MGRWLTPPGLLDPEQEAAEEKEGTRKLRWADCEDEEGVRQGAAEGEWHKARKEQGIMWLDGSYEEQEGHEGSARGVRCVDEWVEESEDQEEEEQEEEKRAQEAREEEKRAQEGREEEKRAQEAREEESRAQEAREEEKRAQEAREE